MPTNVDDNVVQKGESVKEDRDALHGKGGHTLDPELVDVLDELKGKGKKVIAEDSFADLIEDLTSLRFLTFFTVPKVKYTLHFAQHVLFMALLSYLMLVVYRDDVITWWEVLFWVWTTTRAIGELNEIGSFDYRGLRLYARDIWNQQDMLTFSLVVAIIIIRTNVTGASDYVLDANVSIQQSQGVDVLDASVSIQQLQGVESPCRDYVDPGLVAFEPHSDIEATVRNMYSVLVVLVFVRIFQYTRYFQSLGVLSIVIGGVFPDVAVFIFIQFILTLSFGIAFANLQPGAMDAYPSHQILGLSPMWVPFWALYGQFDIDRIQHQINDERPTIVTLPLFLFAYMFIASIIMINLLIAMMSETFSKITSEGLQRWQFERCQLISEFKETKPPLPPPFNIFWLLLVTLPNKYCSKDNRTGTLSGFKTLPTSRQLANLRQQEHDALQKCLNTRNAKRSATLEARSDLIFKEIRKLEDANRARFDNLNGRLENVSSRMDLFTAPLAAKKR